MRVAKTRWSANLYFWAERCAVARSTCTVSILSGWDGVRRRVWPSRSCSLVGLEEEAVPASLAPAVALGVLFVEEGPRCVEGRPAISHRDLLPRRARGARTTRRLARAIHRRSARAAHQSSVPFAPAPSAAESVAREPRLPAAAVAASTSLFSITTSVTLAKLPARSSRAREGEREGKEREYRAPDGGA